MGERAVEVCIPLTWDLIIGIIIEMCPACPHTFKHLPALLYMVNTLIIASLKH